MLKKATAFLLIAGTAFLCYAQTTDTPKGLIEVYPGKSIPAHSCDNGCVVIPVDKVPQLNTFLDEIASRGFSAGEKAAKEYLKNDPKFCPRIAAYSN